MDLILIRHGKAEDLHPQRDGERALTDKGFAQARRQAQRLRDAGKLPEIVLTSPLRRARQTAETFCESAGMPGPLVQGWIAPGMNPDAALRELKGFSEFRTLAIVGHEPDLSSLIAMLLGGTAAAIRMKKGGIACVKINPPSKQGELRYLIPPQY